ncbi:MAG: response regulator [Armatimonadota bacterium]|jgi:DNA-binding NtrC family response regulator
MAHAAVREVTRSEDAAEVLFVDDDAAQREMYRRRLERAGYRVRLADSAEAAAEEVRARAPHVVVLDIAMPGRDGLSCLQELLDIEPAMPVIINTAYPSFTDNFLAWAADAYVEKSGDPRPLLSAIGTAIGGGGSAG